MRLHAAFVADLSRSPHASRLYDMLADGLRSFDPTAFRIYTWIVMPDHVHVVGVVGRAPLGATLWAFKVGTALRLNRLAARRGSVWNREFHDRTLSAEGATVSAMIYVEHNPVRAGLVSDARSWRWSGLHDRLRRAPPDYRGRLAAPSRGGRP